jgi:hypothetical protein
MDVDPQNEEEFRNAEIWEDIQDHLVDFAGEPEKSYF